MHFHVYKKIDFVTSVEQIIVVFVPFESSINKVIIWINIIEFALCLVELQQIKDFLDSLWVASPLTSMEKCRFQTFFRLILLYQKSGKSNFSSKSDNF